MLSWIFRALRLGGVLTSPQAMPSGLQMTPPSPGHRKSKKARLSRLYSYNKNLLNLVSFSSSSHGLNMSVTSSLPGTTNGSVTSSSYHDNDLDDDDLDEARSSVPEFVDLTVVLPGGQVKVITVEYM